MAEKKSKLPKILAILGCAVLLSIGGCVACVGGLAYFGAGEMEKEFCRMLGENETVLAQIGPGPTCDMNFMDFAKVEETGYIEIAITGPNGSGVVRLEIDPNNPEEASGGTLILDSGESFDLGTIDSAMGVPDRVEVPEMEAPAEGA